jgi:hypothetical protein
MSNFTIFPEHIEFLSNFSKNYIKRDGSIAMTNTLDIGTNKIINITTPTNPNDGANKAYVDGVVTGGSNNVEIGGYVQIETNTRLTETSGNSLLTNSATGKNITFQTVDSAINFSVNNGVSNYLSISNLGTITVEKDIIWAETLGQITKTSTDDICMKYSGLTTDTDYAIKQTSNGKTYLNAKTGQSVVLSVNNSELLNLSLSKCILSTDLDIYEAINDGNPALNIGSLATEHISIQTIYDSGAQTLDKVTITTKTASATADKGKIEFYVDDVLISTIKDSGVDLETGQQFEINGTSVLTATTLGSSVINSSLTTIGTLTGISLTGSITQTGGDYTLYDATNDGSPYIGLGSSVTEALIIQSVYESSGQTLNKVTFNTKTAISDANKGQYEFSVDDTLVMTIDDDAINISSGKQYEIDGTSILSSTTLGTSVVNSSLTSVGTLTSLSVSGTVDLESYMALGNGSALDANSGLLIDYDTTYTTIGQQLCILGTVTGASDANVYGVRIAPESITVPDGSTTAIVSSVHITEPNITETGSGSVTTASTVYISDAPTEGANNYALYVASGATALDGSFDVDGASTLDQVTINTTDGDFLVNDGVNTTLRITSSGAIDLATGNESGALNIGTGGNRAITLGAAGSSNTASLALASNGVLTIDSDSTISIDGVGNSNFTVNNGDITISTLTSGNILLSSIGYVDVESVRFTGANIGLSADTDVMVLSSGNLTVNGNVVPGSDNVHDLGTSSLKWDDIYATNSVIQTSDLRLKDNIKLTDLGLDFINSLNPVSFNWKHKNDTVHYGFIAQEIETLLSDKLFGGFVDEDPNNNNSYKGLRYTELIAPIVRAIQELTQKISKLDL